MCLEAFSIASNATERAKGMLFVSKEIVVDEKIEAKILLLRDQRVMLDVDLAELYGVETKVLNRAVKRNIKRFPADFMFQLSENEFQNLRCQFGTSSSHGGRRYLPFVFTEQGVAMLSSVLNSERAMQVNIEIIRTFVKMRKFAATHEELARKVGELEKKLKSQDRDIKMVFATINTMLNPRQKKKKPIGFVKD